jgi:hypothetical protein
MLCYCRSFVFVTFEWGSRLSRIEKQSFYGIGLVEIVILPLATVWNETCFSKCRLLCVWDMNSGQGSRELKWGIPWSRMNEDYYSCVGWRPARHPPCWVQITLLCSYWIKVEIVANWRVGIRLNAHDQCHSLIISTSSRHDLSVGHNGFLLHQSSVQLFLNYGTSQKRICGLLVQIKSISE